MRVVQAGCYFEFVDEEGGILDLPLGDAFDDPKAMGKDPLFDEVDNSVGASSELLDRERGTLMKSKWSLI